MARGSRGFGRAGCLIGALLLVLALVLGIGWLVGNRGLDFGAGKQGPGGSTETPSGETPDRSQPADCPDVELLAVPGTWESSPNDDPANPTANPNSLLKTITGPLQEKYSPDRLKVFTVPYIAQFRNPQLLTDVPYDQSRQEGTDRARAEMSATSARCPFTSYILLGFSQGAVIAGDLTSEIGAGKGPVSAELVKGSVLIADGRRQPGVGTSPGNPPYNGQGMEISLQPATGITQLIAGATMTGPRPGGFGALNDRTSEICEAADLICNAPMSVIDGAARFQEFITNNAAHAQYATNPTVIDGTTTPQWSVEHISQLVDNAEQIAHS